jgi:hypothetical protein
MWMRLGGVRRRISWRPKAMIPVPASKTTVWPSASSSSAEELPPVPIMRRSATG